MSTTNNRPGITILREYMPEITNVKTLSLIGISTGIALLIAHFLNTIDWWVPLLVAIIANLASFWTMARISLNAEKIRITYRKKYTTRAYAKFFYHYVIPVIPPNMLVIFQIIMVENNTFFKMIYPSYASNILYQAIIPWQLAVPLGIFLIGLYALMSRDPVNGGFAIDTELFLYIIYPEKARKLQRGVYEYIRHPHYAEGVYMCFGFALLSQNIIALIFASLFLISYYGIARVEDQELIRRYGASFEKYVKTHPCFIPKRKDLQSFIKLIFLGEIE
ncbi:MAG: hypothetical protein EAX86_10365 [Candidatus Heimdallarchaeota archaeon]|nr:hypothetical protein [Candidatus Heimdallarchaeota archaeon]